MGKVLSAQQKEDLGLLGAQPLPKPDGCPNCEAERRARLATQQQLEECEEEKEKMQEVKKPAKKAEVKDG